jgi:phosphoserine phosphatase RsbU/P
MLQPLFLLAQISVEVYPSELRWELLKISVAIVLLSFGAVAIALFFSRRKARDLTLIYFGLFSVLYGVRLLSNLQTIQLSFGYAPAFWLYVNWVITAVIILPFELFLYQITEGWLKKFLRWLVTIQAVLSLLEIIFTVLGFKLDKLNLVNSVSVLATLFSGPVFYVITRGWTSWRPPLTRELRIFLSGLAVWIVFVLQANLRGLGILKSLDIEFLGFFVFVCCLGYITASRSFAKEEQLVTISKELDIARQIQASTLPREVPRVSGLDIAARYVPMSAVAGDFYDFLVVDAQRLGILVADVTGHGVPAALIASMLKVAFAGQSAHAEDPARVLAGLNRALCGKFEEHFVTAIYVFVDLGKGLLRCAGAGHPPLLLTSLSSGGVRPVEENGLMLGLFPEAAYTSAEIRLRRGDRCLLYTDGLFEATNTSREEFGKERLGEFLQTQSGLPAPRLAAALLEEISRWSGHPTGRRQEDDITLVVVDIQNSPDASE